MYIVFVVVCQKLCRCPIDRNNSKTLDCSNVKLKDHVVPVEIPKDVVGIYLQNSGITQLLNDSFYDCIDVKTLDISSNRDLSTIRNIVLSVMPNLEKIVMTDNNLSYAVSSFPDSTFEGLHRLKSISINRQKPNHKTDISLADFAFMMHRLPPQTLDTLKIDIPSRDGFSQQFMNFTKLSNLEMYNDIKIAITITNDTFQYLRNIPLKKLKIRVRHFSRVQRFAFHHLANLRTLDVKLHDMTVTDFYPALIGLQNTKLKHLKLRTVSSSPTDWVTLNSSFCQNLVLPNLTFLQMDRANLHGIESTGQRKDGCFSKLKKLSLSYNYFTPKSLNSTFNELLNLTNLVKLNVSHQKGSSHQHSRFMRYKFPSHLKKLDMSRIWHYTSKSIDIEFFSQTNLEYLNFRGNSIKVLRNITLTRNDTDIPFEADFSRNNMISFTGSFDNSIKNGVKVVSLVMSENLLGRELAKNGDQVFKYLKDLNKLDLSTNYVTRLPDLIFENNIIMSEQSEFSHEFAVCNQLSNFAYEEFTDSGFIRQSVASIGHEISK